MPDDTPRKPRLIDTPDPERPAPEPEQPRQQLHLGSKQITEVNRPLEATTKPITVQAILAENLRGAVSGFHARQSLMLPPCRKNERYGRRVFYEPWSPRTSSS